MERSADRRDLRCLGLLGLLCLGIVAGVLFCAWHGVQVSG